MADVIQIVVTETGERIPTPIVYYKKMGDSITKLDLEKAKNYKTIHNTDHSIIVTAKGIRNNRLTEEREGILLVHPMVIVDIARRLRTFIIENYKNTKNNIETDSKQSKIYKYVTSMQYNRDAKIRIGIRSNLHELQRKEEDYHRTIWNKRKEFVDKWFEIDNKNDQVINGITQEEQTGSTEQDVLKSEDSHPPNFEFRSLNGKL